MFNLRMELYEPKLIFVVLKEVVVGVGLKKQMSINKTE